MNLSDISIHELKALVYDQLVIIENSQKSIATINKEIQKRIDEPKKEANE